MAPKKKPPVKKAVPRKKPSVKKAVPDAEDEESTQEAAAPKFTRRAVKPVEPAETEEAVTVTEAPEEQAEAPTKRKRRTHAEAAGVKPRESSNGTGVSKVAKLLREAERISNQAAKLQRKEALAAATADAKETAAYATQLEKELGKAVTAAENAAAKLGKLQEKYAEE